MSLFDSIANSLAQTAVGQARSLGNSAAGQISNRISQVSGQAMRDARGNPLAGMAISAATNLAQSALRQGLNSLIGGNLPSFGGRGGGACSPPILGGISLDEAAAIHRRQVEQEYAKKNLWMIDVLSSPLAGEFSDPFNFFATSVEYSPLTLSGDKIKIGAAVVDSVLSGEPVEMRITTRDDKQGTIRRWFDMHAAAQVSSDGTVGYPADYGISIRVVKAFITEGSNQGGHDDYGLFRASNIDVNLNRAEDAFLELNMTFLQLDTFMAWR